MYLYAYGSYGFGATASFSSSRLSLLDRFDQILIMQDGRLVAQGSHLTNVLAFQRGENLIAMVPRFTLTLNGEWGDTRLPLPPGRWAEAFGSGVHEGEAPAASVFASFPVALLVRESA